MSIQHESEEHIQSARRSHAVLNDQHGRSYSAIIEQMPRSNHPTGPVTPCIAPEYGFETLGPERAAAYNEWCVENHLWPYSPVMPPEKYVRPDPRNSARVIVDYPSWRADVLSAHEDWWASVIEASRLYYKEEARNVVDKIRETGEVPRYLLDLFGPAPLDLRIVDTCASGKSRWILGLPDQNGQPLPRPQWADEILPEPEPLPDYLGFADEGEHEGFADDPWTGEPETLDGALSTEPQRNKGGRPRKQTVEA